MRDLNIEFIDLYKTVDKFIKDAYSSTDGVSEYIRLMEQNVFKGIRYVPSWSADHDKLKRLRWIRNQLSHEVGYDSDICEEADLERLQDFKDRLYSADDPLAVLKRAEDAARAQSRTPAPRQTAAANVPRAQREKAPRKKKRGRGTLILILIIIAVYTALFIYHNSRKPGVEKAAESSAAVEMTLENTPVRGPENA